ncbi:PDR/VanB family oxidoreductase [Nocardiopsis composta]|uniref:PDR/VanB family oxidoreductase n=1 Tax=Nocardiopsis composta TaxID=157465 RepID=UPI0031D990F1
MTRRAPACPPPPLVRWAAGTALLGAVLAAAVAVAGIAGGTAAPGAVGWSAVAAAGLAFHGLMARAGRRWGRVLLPVSGAAALGGLFPEAAGGLPRWLLIGALAACLAASAALFLPPAAAWFRERGDSARLMGTGLRKAVLAVHVIVALVWTGVIVTMAALALTALADPGPAAVRGLTTAMLAIEANLLGPPALVALLTGVALACGTRWGLLEHRWVAAKFWLITAGIISAPFLNRPALFAVQEAAFGGAPAEEVRAAMQHLALVYPGIPAAALAAAVLSFTRPWGRTRRGRRAAERRRAPARRIPARVTAADPVAEGVVALRLERTGGADLPPWTPGAHIDLVLPSGRVRQYSLHGDPADRSAYRVAVLHEPGGLRGSAEAHRLRAGDRVAIGGPRNRFPLADAAAHLFIAGGIGIVPLLPMIRELDARGAPWRLVYVGRSLPAMAFARELAEAHPDRVRLFPRDACDRPDLGAVLREAPEGAAVHCCGPAGLIAGVEAELPAARPDATLHTERFAPADRAAGAPDAPFDAELRRTGGTVRVPAGTTLLDALRERVPGADASCENGVCGGCEVRVLAGVPEHRDDVLAGEDRDRTDVIFPCVSRARGRIVLDL